MFRFDLYCEKWAEKFKPISHNPGVGSRDNAFYRMDSFSRIDSLCTSLPTAKSPAMAVVTLIDAELGGRSNHFINHSLQAFILVRQNEASIAKGKEDELLAADAKEKGYEIAEKFLAYLEQDKKVNPELKGMSFDKCTVFTHPSKYGNWWATEIIMENLVPRNICVDPADYIKSE